jgi:hypothetical protein
MLRLQILQEIPVYPGIAESKMLGVVISASETTKIPSAK